MFIRSGIKYLSYALGLDLAINKLFSSVLDYGTEVVEKDHPVYRKVKHICKNYNTDSNKIFIRTDKRDFGTKTYSYPSIQFDYKSGLYLQFNVVMPLWYIALCETKTYTENPLSISNTIQSLHLIHKSDDVFFKSYFVTPDKKKSLVNQIEISSKLFNDKSFCGLYKKTQGIIMPKLIDANKEIIESYDFVLAHEIAHYSFVKFPFDPFDLIFSHIQPHHIEYECDRKASLLYKNDAIKLFTNNIIIGNLYQGIKTTFRNGGVKNGNIEIIKIHPKNIRENKTTFSHPSTKDRLLRVLNNK